MYVCIYESMDALHVSRKYERLCTCADIASQMSIIQVYKT